MAESAKAAEGRGAINPRGVYAIKGESLLKAIGLLNNEIPCRYLHVVDALTDILAASEEIRFGAGQEGDGPGEEVTD